MIANIKKYLKSIIILILCLIIIPQSLVWIFSFSMPKKADAILILGCRVKDSQPESMLKYRLDKGLELYNKGYGEYVIVSGGQGPDENMPEGEAMKQYLISRGIDESKITVENKSKSTYENLKFSKSLIKNKAHSVIIVTSRFHIFRSMITAKKFGVVATFAGSKIDLQDGWYYLREVPAIYKYIIKY